ncbi:prolipoprotein diacylglyceryl transferase [Mobiluncus curtisii]|uniref:prolipoprotein diacylglyceryl transferase n=4 Tax=Mobiluncus curtisii TaxID=2051 RepID=UPI0014707FB9|nr:prolipoprotein diacylglyceryl transferase [Mobiluncus curtisii]NMW47895.1 prolipoprotein diacylglyceryl transferase [Mobiluncus curtisii]
MFSLSFTPALAVLSTYHGLLSAVRTSIPSPPSPILFSLGPLTVRWYAFWIILGMALAIFWTSKRYQARGGDPELVGDIGVWICLLGIVGARAMAVFSYPGDYFGPGIPWWKPFAIWQGGLAIYGGIIGGFLAIVCFLRVKRQPVGVFLDALAPAMLAAQALGRLGNYFNQEVYGRATTLPWGLEISPQMAPANTAPGTLFHPTFLYEIIWNLFAMGILLLYEKLRKRSHNSEFVQQADLCPPTNQSWGRLCAWEIIGLYLFLYSLGRFFLEFVRIDYQYTVAGGVRWFQVVAGVIAVAGLAVFGVARYRKLPPVLTEVTHSAPDCPETQSIELNREKSPFEPESKSEPKMTASTEKDPEK